MSKINKKNWIYQMYPVKLVTKMKKRKINYLMKKTLKKMIIKLKGLENSMITKSHKQLNLKKYQNLNIWIIMILI